MQVEVTGWVCADFGSNVGGFTDCLLQRGAARVYAIDTGYGDLAWTLRKDPRVVVMERTNAMHCELPERVDLVVIDAAWTPQRSIVPEAIKHLKPGGKIVSLLKPHYEFAKLHGHKPRGILTVSQSDEICCEVCRILAEECHCRVQAVMRSPIKGKGGNTEFLFLGGPPKDEYNV